MFCSTSLDQYEKPYHVQRTALARNIVRIYLFTSFVSHSITWVIYVLHIRARVSLPKHSVLVDQGFNFKIIRVRHSLGMK